METLLACARGIAGRGFRRQTFQGECHKADGIRDERNPGLAALRLLSSGL
jgi:hypothetical protein